ncbi:hypothetical protein [Anaeromassilibacillus senegalensis]|uniref:hypothetical protein n=1 Tax=Anaeromassilibacillus senegalensis TaxID=1673717 RepID=UPI000681FA22|nr:hypothetical protein [Anaeromassilibacillus senegalensis]
MNKDSPYIKHSRLGVILFVTGLIGAFLTAMASDSGMLTVYQVLIMTTAESLAMGIGGLLRDKDSQNGGREKQK